jgi:hypothetical protein
MVAADFLSLTQAERVEYAIQRLLKMSAKSRPRQLKTLNHSLHAQFAKQLSDGEIQGIADVLVNKGLVIQGGSENVTCQLQA